MISALLTAILALCLVNTVMILILLKMFQSSSVNPPSDDENFRTARSTEVKGFDSE